MRATAFALLFACGLLFVPAAARGNRAPPPPPPKDPAPATPKPADPMTPLAGLGAAVGAVALGAWFLRRSTTRPGN